MKRQSGFLIGLASLLFPELVLAQSPYMYLFDKPEYQVPVVSLSGSDFAGDKNASYNEVLVPVASNLEVLIIGEFPRSGFFSISLYDDHGAIIDVLNDYEIEPLDPNQQNPYRPDGAAGTEDILYAVTIRLGQNLATSPFPECGFGSYNVHQNLMDGRQHHTAGNYYSPQQRGFSVPFKVGIHFTPPASGCARLLVGTEATNHNI